MNLRRKKFVVPPSGRSRGWRTFRLKPGLRTKLFLRCIAITLLIAFQPEARADVLVVSEGQSIRDALSRAQPGDTIQVQAGVYEEDIAIDKTITLEGAGRPVIRGAGRGSVLIVLADRCVIKGFVIERTGGDLQKEDSGILLKSRGNRVEDNIVRDALYGIYLFRSAGNVIRANAIEGRSALEPGERGAGLHLWDSPDNTIEDNSILHSRDGLYIQSSPGNRIYRNRISKVRYGIHYMSSNDNHFEDNLFSDSVAGAAIMYSKKIEFRRNVFLRNRGFSSFGILFQDCEDCLAEDNFIIDNATGIFMEALTRSTFRRNTIAGNDVAFQIFSSATENVFTENRFIENLSPLLLIGRKTNNRWEADGRGNYWSDYDGYDLDADGIGDAPHRVQNVFEYLEGNYPRLRLYLYSPAAQALAMAEKSFPVIRGSNEKDPWPIMRATVARFPIEQPQPKLPRMIMALASLTMLVISLAIVRKGWRR
jgi:nitrous oxidase accessory protein